MIFLDFKKFIEKTQQQKYEFNWTDIISNSKF